MHDLSGADDMAAEGLSNTLMTKADAEDWNLAGKGGNGRQ